MLTLPLFGFLSGAVLVYLMLAQGARLALIEAAVAGALILALAAILSMPLEPRLWGIVSVWLPGVLVGGLLVYSGSLTLTLQVSAIVAVVGVLAFFATAGNPVDFWTSFLNALVEAWREADLNEQADRVAPAVGALAEHMTVWVAFASWALAAVMLLLGYALYQQKPGEKRSFGRFRDLDFGRVIAAVMAVTSLVAVVANASWLQSVAFLLFAIFSLQGIAIVHWLHANGVVPVFVVILMYGTMVVLSPIIITAMAVLGYIDAWFGLRRRKAKPPGARMD